MKSLVNGELFKAITTKKLVPFPSTAGSNSREQSLDLCVNRLLDLIKNFYASLKKCKGRLGLEAGVLFSPAVKKKEKISRNIKKMKREAGFGSRCSFWTPPKKKTKKKKKGQVPVFYDSPIHSVQLAPLMGG